MLLLFLTGAGKARAHGGHGSRVIGRMPPFPRDFAKPEEEKHKQAEFIAMTFLHLQANVPVSQRIIK
jgi:hypothetical protein